MTLLDDIKTDIGLFLADDAESSEAIQVNGYDCNGIVSALQLDTIVDTFDVSSHDRYVMLSEANFLASSAVSGNNVTIDDVSYTITKILDDGYGLIKLHIQRDLAPNNVITDSDGDPLTTIGGDYIVSTEGYS